MLQQCCNLSFFVAVDGLAPSPLGLIPAALLLSYTAPYPQLTPVLILVALPGAHTHLVILNTVRASIGTVASQLLSAMALAMSARPVTLFTAHCLSSAYVFVSE